MVFLDGGLGVYSGMWYQVAPQVSEFTRVCRCDRAGMGQSSPAPSPRTSQVMVEELHTLLTNASIAGPHVVVGHSLAGLNIRLYASRYPQEVVGPVFVDAFHPDLDIRLEPRLTPERVQERRDELELN